MARNPNDPYKRLADDEGDLYQSAQQQPAQTAVGRPTVVQQPKPAGQASQPAPPAGGGMPPPPPKPPPSQFARTTAAEGPDALAAYASTSMPPTLVERTRAPVRERARALDSTGSIPMSDAPPETPGAVPKTDLRPVVSDDSALEGAPSAPQLGDYESIGMDPLGELPQFQAPDAPPPPEGYEALFDYAQDWLKNPNPYMSDLAQATRAESEARLGAMREEGERGISEWASKRGLLGSSVEGEKMVELTGELQRIAQDDERKFLELLVNAEAEGRSQAFQNALATAQLSEEAQQFRAQYMMDAEKFGFDSAFKTVQLQQQDALDRARLDLDAAIAGDAAAMDKVRYELDRLRAMDEAILNRDELALREQDINLRAEQIRNMDALDRARYELDRFRAVDESKLSREELAQRQQEIQQRAREIEQRDEQLDAEQARWQAEYDMRDEQWEEDQQRYQDWLELQGGDPGKKPAERPQGTYGGPGGEGGYGTPGGEGGYEDPYADDYYSENLY